MTDIQEKLDTLSGLYSKGSSGKISFSANLETGTLYSGKNIMMRCFSDEDEPNDRFQLDLVLLMSLHKYFPDILSYIRELENNQEKK